MWAVGMECSSFVVEIGKAAWATGFVGSFYPGLDSLVDSVGMNLCRAPCLLVQLGHP